MRPLVQCSVCGYYRNGVCQESPTPLRKQDHDACSRGWPDYGISPTEVRLYQGLLRTVYRALDKAYEDKTNPLDSPQLSAWMAQAKKTLFGDEKSQGSVPAAGELAQVEDKKMFTFATTKASDDLGLGSRYRVVLSGHPAAVNSPVIWVDDIRLDDLDGDGDRRGIMDLEELEREILRFLGNHGDSHGVRHQEGSLRYRAEEMDTGKDEPPVTFGGYRFQFVETTQTYKLDGGPRKLPLKADEDEDEDHTYVKEVFEEPPNEE